MTAPILVDVNLAGFVEAPTSGSTPFQVDRDGHPYLPVGDGGVVLGVELGDGVFEVAGDHVAPGVTLVHPDQAARHGLTTFACTGNQVVVRSGRAAGAVGRVLGKRGEAGRVVAVFEPNVLENLAPGDAVLVRGRGQGAELPSALAATGAVLVNVDPEMLSVLGVQISERLSVNIRACVPSKLVGNGLGRPTQQWDLDLSIDQLEAPRWGLSRWRLGDLIAVADLDVRHNAGYRQGWTTVGITVHGGSPLPGHGPGVMPILCAPSSVFDLDIDPVDHRGLTTSQIRLERD